MSILPIGSSMAKLSFGKGSRGWLLAIVFPNCLPQAFARSYMSHTSDTPYSCFKNRVPVGSAKKSLF